MKAKMWARSRNTGYDWTLIDQNLTPDSVTFSDRGEVQVKIKIDNLSTSGNFDGVMSLSIHELYYILGAAEQHRAKRQKEKFERVNKRLEKLEPDNPLREIFGEFMNDAS